MTCRGGGMGSHAFILMHALSTLTSARMMKAFRAAQHTRRGHSAHVMPLIHTASAKPNA